MSSSVVISKRRNSMVHICDNARSQYVFAEVIPIHALYATRPSRDLIDRSGWIQQHDFVNFRPPSFNQSNRFLLQFCSSHAKDSSTRLKRISCYCSGCLDSLSSEPCHALTKTSALLADLPDPAPPAERHSHAASVATINALAAASATTSDARYTSASAFFAHNCCDSASTFLRVSSNRRYYPLPTIAADHCSPPVDASFTTNVRSATWTYLLLQCSNLLAQTETETKSPFALDSAPAAASAHTPCDSANARLSSAF